MDVQTLEAVLAEIDRQQEVARQTIHPDYMDHIMGMADAYQGLRVALRDTIKHEADIGTKEMVRQEQEHAERSRLNKMFNQLQASRKIS